MTRKPRSQILTRADAFQRRPPNHLERAYLRVLKQRIEAIARLMEREVVPLIERNASEIDQRARQDSPEEIVRQITRVLGGVQLAAEGSWDRTEDSDFVKGIARQVDLFERRQLERQWKSALGVEPFFADKATQGAIEDFAAQNLQLITNMQRDIIASAEENLIEAARSGQRSEDFKEIIQKRLGVGESRARLIARDQIGSMNGQLAQIRQRELGVESYRWSTSNDERVRPEHKARDGEIFSWGFPPRDGHPGQPIQCRCTADPVIEDLI